MNRRKRKKITMTTAKDNEKLPEDLDDLAVIAERRNEETISHEELKRNLKRNGLSR